MHQAARVGARFGLGAVVLFVLVVACTGVDPILRDEDTDAAPLEAGAEASATGSAEAASDAPGVEATVTRPECLHVPPVGCTKTALDGTQPMLHLDACALSELAVERELSVWPPVVGPTLAPAPQGAGIYCATGLNNRPAVRFQDSRGYESAAAAALDYTDTLLVFAALSYERRDGAPGSVIFARSEDTQGTGFPGPALFGNITYVREFGTLALVPSPGIGLQLRLGERPASKTPTPTDSIAAATLDYRSGPLIVVARLVPIAGTADQTMELRINGKSEARTIITGGFTSTGERQTLRIGHTTQATNAFFGYLGELMIFGTDRSDYLDIETAMLAKWGVPPAR